MLPVEMIGLILLSVAGIVIIAMLGPASLGALVGAGAAIGVMRFTRPRR